MRASTERSSVGAKFASLFRTEVTKTTVERIPVAAAKYACPVRVIVVDPIKTDTFTARSILRRLALRRGVSMRFLQSFHMDNQRVGRRLEQIEFID